MLKFFIIKKLIYKIISLFEPVDKRVLVVSNEELAADLKKKFKGKTDLLKSIEKAMNTNVKKSNYISLL